MGTILDSQNKEQFYIFDLQFGDPSLPSWYRFTDWTRGVNVVGLSYDSVPELEVRWPNRDGGLTPEALALRVPTSIATFGRLAGPESIESVYLTVTSVLRSSTNDAEEERYVEYTGRFHKAIDNYQGSQGVALLEFTDRLKGDLDVALGVPALHTCVWTFGNERGSPCGLDVATFRQTATVNGTTSGGYIVSLSGLSVPTTPGGGAGASGYWHRGYLELDGLRLGIREWLAAAPSQFKMSEPVPDSWVGEDVTATPGCDKLLQTCQERWDREESFGGIGYAMVPYNPNLESQ